MDEIQFTVPEILSLIGMTQCVYLVVHLVLKKGAMRIRVLPLVFFFCLGFAFFLDAAQSRLSPEVDYYFYAQWFFWFIGPPLSVLLVVQISDIKRVPALKEYWVLLLLPLSFMVAHLAVEATGSCVELATCAELKDILNILGFMSGAIALLIIFSKYQIFKSLRLQKSGRARYWLILSLIFLNALFLSVMLLSLNGQIPPEETRLLKTLFGAGFVYLVSTSFFRIFPKNKKAPVVDVQSETSLSAGDKQVIARIERLFALDKIYQEQSYSRTDIAQECGVSEASISRLINIHYQKSFPQLMNEYRIKDAQQLLSETRAPVKVIASEVGFNSLPSFNRAFKEIVDMSPTDFRDQAQKTSQKL